MVLAQVRTLVLLLSWPIVGCSADAPRHLSEAGLDARRLEDSRTADHAADLAPRADLRGPVSDEGGDGWSAERGPAAEGGVDGRLVDLWIRSALRVATFNTHCLIEEPGRRAAGIADEIARIQPDVIGLQELCEPIGKPDENFGRLLVAALKSRHQQEWTLRWSKTHRSWDLYEEGLGLLIPATSTVRDFGEAALPQGGGAFPRKVLWALLDTPGGTSCYFYNTHLTISPDPADRANQAEAISALAYTHSSAGLVQVVVGDFNDWYASAAVEQLKAGPPAMVESWGNVHPGTTDPGMTCCSPDFQNRIDYIFVSRARLESYEAVELAFDQLYEGTLALSDHRGLFAAFRARP